MTELPSEPASPHPTFGRFSETAELDLRHYWQMLLRRRRLILSCVAITVTVVMVGTLLTTPRYRGIATIQIQPHGPDILTFKDVVSPDTSFMGYQNYYQTQYKILQSRAVLRLAAERLDLTNRPEYAGRRSPPVSRLAAWLKTRLGSAAPADRSAEDPLEPGIRFIAARLEVEPVRNSHLVRVKALDRDPVLARDIANAVSDAYQQFSLSVKYETTAQASDFLAKQVATLREEIAEQERRLQEYSARKEILAIRDETQDISSKALGDLNTSLVQARGRLALARARHQALIDTLPSALPEVMDSPLINGLKREYAEQEREYTQMAERFKPEWPTLRNLEQELQKSRERLERQIELIATQVRDAAASDLERAKGEVAALEAEVEGQKLVVRKVSRDAIEFEGLRAEIETKRAFLSELVNRESQTTVSDRLRDTSASNVRTVDPAITPQHPVHPRKQMNLLLALFAGLGIGIAAAALAEHLDNTIKTEADVEAITEIRVLGHVPLHSPLKLMGYEREDPASGPGSSDLASYGDPKSAFAEAFRSLRTAILLASPEHPPRTILVTSCEPGDGKSLVAINLALVLTQLGRRVLLVDADLRRPRLHRVFGVGNAVGLSSYLTGNAALEEIVQSTDIPSLDLLSSGPVPPTPSELLGSPGLQNLLNGMVGAAGFDHVVLDSPPALQVTDSVLLAARADASVLVVRWEKTSRGGLAAGVERLRSARARLVGAVLNGVTERSTYSYTDYVYGPTEETSPKRRTRGKSKPVVGTQVGRVKL